MNPAGLGWGSQRGIAENLSVDDKTAAAERLGGYVGRRAVEDDQKRHATRCRIEANRLRAAERFSG